MTVTSAVLSTRLVRLQLGQESTWGNAATATSILNGVTPMPTITPISKATQFDEQRGSLAPSYTSAQLARGGNFSLTGFATYEDILYLLGAAYGLPTPTGNGATKNITAVAVAGTKTISANSLASPTVIQTSTTHGLINGEYVTISGSNSTPLIDGNWPITYVDTTHFSVPVNCSVAGTSGSVATPSIVQTSATHGLTTGGTVIISGSASTPSVDGVWTVAVTDTTHFAINAFCSGSGGTFGTVANPATWTFVPPSTATWNPVAYTMELGILGVATATKLAGSLVQAWTSSGEAGQEMTWTASGFGKSVTFGATPTANLQYRSAEIAITPQLVGFSIDPVGGTPGTTAISGMLVSFSMDGNTGLMPWTPAGSLTPTTFVCGKQTLTMKLVMAYTAATMATITTTTGLLSAGSQIVTQVQAVSGNKSITLPFCGSLQTDAQLWGDKDGAQIVELDMAAVVDPTLGYYAAPVVCNALGTLA